MRLFPKKRSELVDAAFGKRPCDLVIKNANMVNVFTGEIYKAEIGIYDGFIAHIKCDPDKLKKDETELKGNTYYDADNSYVIPGFIDSHIHIESSFMTPANFTKATIIHGTTTVITDPHEIANVCGIDGVKYMHDSSHNLPMRHFILAPSCVPSVPGIENGGAEFNEHDISELLELERVIGLAEVMDYNGVINNDARMVNILDSVLNKSMFIQGHLFYNSSRELSAYACGGPLSDHESNTGTEARDKLRIGMHIDAREGSICQNINEIISNTKDFKYIDNISFATDDMEVHDIIKKGHINHVVMQAIKSGMHPIDAIRSATINAAREIGITNLGAIAPGYVADLIITDSLSKIRPKAVFYEGIQVVENYDLKATLKNNSYILENTNTINISNLSLEDFKIKSPIKNGKVKCNIININTEKPYLTEPAIITVDAANGYIDISNDPGLKYAIVINRYGKKTFSKAIIKGYGMQKGAFGSTYAHDCHNIIIIYDNCGNAIEVLKDLEKMKGGFSCTQNGEILDHFALPVAGLMSNEPIEILYDQIQNFKNTLSSLGFNNVEYSMLAMSVLSLTVAPCIRLTDLGLFDVINQKHINMFSE